MNEIPTQKTLEVRVGENVKISCPALSKVIKRDGTFEAVYWNYYCNSKPCDSLGTEWPWLAGMNKEGKIKATKEGMIFWS